MPRPVRPGDPLDRSAETHNAFVAAANAIPGLQATPEERATTRTHTAKIKNIGNQALRRGDAIELGEPVFDPIESEREFDAHPWMTGFRGVFAPDDPGPPAIVLRAIPPGKVGEAVVFGQASVRDFVRLDLTHRRGRIGANGQVVSAEEGPFAVAWASPEAQPDGRRRALVVITGDTGSGGARFARITNAEELGTNRWRYWYEVVRFAVSPDADQSLIDAFQAGSWAPTSPPLTHADLGYAINAMESGNSQSGVQPIGVNISNLPGDFRIQRIGDGAIVRLYGPFVSDESAEARITIFSMPNSVDGGCP